MAREEVYGERDRVYLQKLEKERYGLSGPKATYYSLNRGQNVDPLYQEPRGWSYEKFSIRVGIEYQEMESRDPSVREEGFETEYDAIVHIAKLEWDENCPTNLNESGTTIVRRPKEGDVIYVQEEYFDVTKANSGGNVIDQPTFVGYKVELRKKIRFDAKRKVAPANVA